MARRVGSASAAKTASRFSGCIAKRGGSITIWFHKHRHRSITADDGLPLSIGSAPALAHVVNEGAAVFAHGTYHRRRRVSRFVPSRPDHEFDEHRSQIDPLGREPVDEPPGIRWIASLPDEA